MRTWRPRHPFPLPRSVKVRETGKGVAARRRSDTGRKPKDEGADAMKRGRNAGAKAARRESGAAVDDAVAVDDAGVDADSVEATTTPSESVDDEDVSGR